MSITVTVPQDDAVALQAAADMLNTIARARVGLAPVGCGCVDRKDEHASYLGPITQHCLELAKAANEAAYPAAILEHEASNPPTHQQFASAIPGVTPDPAAVFAQPAAAAPAPPLPPMDDPRVVPALSGTYTSPTGQLAPGVAPAPPQAPPAIAQLDRNGLPWDERINTSNKAQTQQGVWKRKPGLTDDQYNGVIAELRTAQGASVAPAAPAPPTTAETVTLQNVVAPAACATVSVGLVPAPPAPVVTPEPPPNVPAPPATDDTVPQTISQLIPIVTQAINSGKITIEAVNAIIKDVTGGAIPSMPVLATAQQHIPAVYEHLKNAWSMA